MEEAREIRKLLNIFKARLVKGKGRRFSLKLGFDHCGTLLLFFSVVFRRETCIFAIVVYSLLFVETDFQSERL
jgi:hypothetical protein